MKENIKKFISDKKGMELMRFAIIVVITASLIVTAMAMRDITVEAIKKAHQIADEEFRGTQQELADETETKPEVQANDVKEEIAEKDPYDNARYIVLIAAAGLLFVIIPGIFKKERDRKYEISGDFNGNISGENVTIVLAGENSDINGDIGAASANVVMAGKDSDINGNVTMREGNVIVTENETDKEQDTAETETDNAEGIAGNEMPKK